MSYVSFVAGILLYAAGMVLWSKNYQDYRHGLGLGLAAGGMLLLVVGVATAPGW